MITSILPPIMAINYYFIMSKPHLEAEASRLRLAVNELEKDQTAGDKYTIIVDQESSADHLSDPDSNDLKPPEQMKITERFSVIIRPLIWPFMLPLFLVFWAEYTINQGVFPALLFPLESTPFKNMRDHYVYYQFIYQIGVFISRSSLRFFPVKQIFALSLAQVSVLVVLLLQALLSYIPSVYIVFIIILIEGLFGGSTYINAFHQISQTTPAIHREFAMGAAAVADTLGITMAGITSALIGPWLCHRNVLCSK